MNIKELKELLEMLKALDSGEAESPVNSEDSALVGEYVIVRCKDAGVHAGYLVHIQGRRVTLRDSRRLWKWKAGGNSHTLSGVAEHGLAEGSCLPSGVDWIELLEACEVIEVSSNAATSIQEWPVHEAN